MQQDEAGGQWLLRLLMLVMFLVTGQAAAQVQRTFVNPGFEVPVLPSNNCYSIRAEVDVPGWSTTEPPFTGAWNTSSHGTCGGHPATPPDGGIQMFRGNGGGRLPNAGNQYAELNAFTPSRLYQEVCLLQGEQIGWSLAHSARSSANETASFNIGTDPSGTGSQQIVRMRAGNTVAQGPVACSLGTCSLNSIDANGWREYSGSFNWNQPTGLQTIGFQAISGGSVGNVLDDIQIGLRPFVEFAQAAYTQNEASPTGNRPRLLVAGTVPTGGITVPVTITGGTATLGLDYTTDSGTTDVSVFIPAGVYDSASFPLPITIVNDGPGDSDETITFATPDTAGTGAPYNRASLQSCGGVPLASTTSTISENPDPLPRIQLSKALSANRLSVDDQFVVRIDGTNGQQTTTSGAGSAVANGTITVGPATIGASYTLSEVMSAGSTSALSAYAPSISCTNTTPNSSTVLPSGAGSSFSLTVAATDNISCTITNDVAAAPAFIDVVKTVTSGQLYDSVGDVATYSYVVTNTGATSVDTLTVTDNRIATVSCPVTALAAAPGPGNSTTCTGSYTITQADIDDVLVTNIAQASARNTLNGQIAIDTDDAVINRAFPAITADKQTTAPNFASLGQVIPYTYAVTNTGNVTIDNLTVTDNRIATVSCPVTTLAPGTSTTCSGNYTITQADLDAGSLTNVMTATGTPPAGTLAAVTDSVILIGPAAAPALTLDKSSTTTTYATAGQVVPYSYRVTNTGNVTISALTVTDDRIATVSCPATTLAPAASTTCTASYTITQADLDAGSVTNTASANATPARGTLAPATDSVTVNATELPALALMKTAVSGDPYDEVGGVVNYQYLVTNTGNVTISTVTVTDDRIATVSCPQTTLAPGASTLCTASYTITQVDLDAGSVTNNATANGVPAQGALTPATANEIVSATGRPRLTLDKTAVAGNPYDAAGDVIDYQYVVTNTGNVTINTLTVTDNRIATVNCPVTTLAPGASVTCTASYTIIQADVDAGLVTNDAEATGTPTVGTLSPATASETVTSISTPALTLAKTAVAGAPYDAVGDVVSYEYVVTNPSNVTITAISVTDDRIASVICPVTTLPPGASTTCTGTYTITQSDLDNTSVTNIATATGTPASGTLVPDTDSATVHATLAPALTLVKTAVAGAPFDAVGDVIDYEYLVTNTGNVTIDALVVTDTRIPMVSCPVATLAPGASMTCTASYTVIQADLDAGVITNIARATGSPPTLVPSTDTESVAAVSAPSLTLVKTAVAGAPYDTLGDVVSYRYVVTNTGNVTISSLTVADDKIATVSCPVAVLAPAASTMCSASYTITQADLDAGSVTNNATATGTPASGTLAPGTDSATVIALPAVSYSKTASTAGPVAVGDTLTYTLTLTVAQAATANVATLTDTLGAGLDFIGVTSAGAFTCNDVNPLVCTLPAGTPTGTYAMTYQARVNASASGTADNTVIGSGADAHACAAECAIATPVAAPIITLTKSSDPAADTDVRIGEAIQYTLTATVSNSATLGELVMVDSPDRGLTISAVPNGCSMSGSNMTCTLPAGTPAGVHTFVYSATVNEQAGAAVNNAVTASVGAGEPPLCTTCSITHQIETPYLRLAKVASVREVKIGDLVAYTLTVENLGDVNLVGGSVVDTPAAGLSYVEGSLRIADGDNRATVEGQHPLRFNGLDVAAGETATLIYVMRVGAGVRRGTHINSAQVRSSRGTLISNVATARVELVPDPLLDDTLIFGTVFDDRDGDGWQDSAALRDVRVRGGFAPGVYVAHSTTLDRGGGPQPLPDASAPLLHGIAVGAIAARQSEADPLDARQIIIRQTLSELAFTDDFLLTSAQGVTVRMDAAGNITVEKSGEAAKGLNAAAPTIERRVAVGEGGYIVDYVVRNAGVDERGIPGVRIASVEGLLMETDQFGRYHMAGISGGASERGRNFILKLDPSTLPAAAALTSDNPLVRRITPGLPVRFDWGVKLPVEVIEGGTEHVEMALGEVFFAPGSAEVRAQYLPVVEKIAAKVREYNGGEVIINAGGGTESLAFDRATAVKEALLPLLDAASVEGLVISARGSVDDLDSLVVGVDEGGALLGTVLFDTNQSAIRPEFEPLLDKVAAALDRMGGGVIAIVGHTDIRASYDYNAGLGLRRAEAVFDALAKRLSPQVRARLRVEASNDPTASVDGKGARQRTDGSSR